MSTATEIERLTDPTVKPPRRRLTKDEKRRLALILTFVVAALLILRMRNTAFIDEALYINAGHVYIDHWRFGSSVGDAGAYFSGHPLLYPVLAGALDAVGGLTLVRAFSLLCILTAAWALNRTATHLWGPRAGLITAAVFLFTGPVMFMGGLATFDAPVAAMICLALWLGITQPSLWSAVLAGGVLALETATKYTGGIFIPVVIAAMVVAGHRGWQRAIVATLTTGGILSLVWWRWGDAVREDLAFTTTARKALSPATTSTLLGYAWSYLGVLIVISLISLLIAFRSEGVRKGMLCIGFLGAAAMLPVAQMRLGEAVSFEKHLGFSAIFLSLVAGLATTRISELPLMVAPSVLLMVILLMIGWARSDHMYQWVNVTPVIKAIESDSKPGIYISSATDSLKYHTRSRDNIRWETTFNLYVEGEEEIRRAILSERYQAVILRTASTGNPDQDRGQEVMLDALRSSPSYDLAFEPFPVTRTANDHWLFYTLITRAAPATRTMGGSGSDWAEHNRER